MSRSQFIERAWIWKMPARPSRSGRPNSTLVRVRVRVRVRVGVRVRVRVRVRV